MEASRCSGEMNLKDNYPLEKYQSFGEMMLQMYPFWLIKYCNTGEVKLILLNVN